MTLWRNLISGKLKLEPAKNKPSTTELMKKIGQISKEPLPPIKQINDEKSAKKSTSNNQAFTVVFDDNSNKMKMKKYSKYQGIPKRDMTSHSKNEIDDR